MEIAIFDIDGTLADCTHRQHHLTAGKKNWDAFYAAMATDTPRVAIVNLLRMCWANDMPVVLCTGRPASYREMTIAWLREHDIRFYELYMRSTGDFRDDAIVKREMLQTIRCVFTPVLVVDDRDKVVAMWRSEGLTCLQCAPGSF